MLRAVGAAAAIAIAVTATSSAQTTLDQTLKGADPSKGYAFLGTGPGEGHKLRQEIAKVVKGRDERRRSLVYFGQITDFQLSDEETPARVEFADIDPTLTAKSAWRPQEALLAHQADASVRAMNRLRTSTVEQGSGKHARLANVVLTGDLADNSQRNESQWVVKLLEGGTIDPGSGTNDFSSCSAPSAVAAQAALDDAEAERYTGVQDYDDYLGSTAFYDPDSPQGQYAGWPRYPGLMDRAQAPFTAAGLDVPSYIVYGNHDGLVQGNQAANRGIEDVAIGCVKPLAPATPLGSSPGDLPDALPPGALSALDPSYLQGVFANPSKAMLVPPDENRQFVNKPQFKALAKAGAQSDGHGFGLVDKDEEQASSGAAGYYDFSPREGIRFIVLDTLSEGGITPISSEGNVDDPQFRWLESELKAATKRDELVVLFSHHAPSSSLSADLDDEIAPPCTSNDSHGHDTNPGCDRDPRSSAPIHLGDDVTDLLHKYPHAIAFVAGHSHESQVNAIKKPGGNGDYWELKSPAIADWPPQHRVIEVMDNRDGTLSIFATLVDLEAAVRSAGAGTPAGGLAASELASIGRTIEFNDPQEGPDGSEGERTDRNVELVVRDPRRSTAAALEDEDDGSGGDGGSGDDSSYGDGSGGAAAAGTAGGSLPFTGYVLLPLLLLGLLLATAGALVRRGAGR